MRGDPGRWRAVRGGPGRRQAVMKGDVGALELGMRTTQGSLEVGVA